MSHKPMKIVKIALHLSAGAEVEIINDIAATLRGNEREHRAAANVQCPMGRARTIPYDYILINFIARIVPAPVIYLRIFFVITFFI